MPVASLSVQVEFVASLLASLPAGSTKCWPSLAAAAGLVLEHLPDSFLSMRHHVLPKAAADSAEMQTNRRKLLAKVWGVEG